MLRHALIIGKFYPPHNGHHFLIDLAASECERVTVLVLGHPREEASLTRMARRTLLKDRHPGVEVHEVECDLPVDYTSREATRNHAHLIHQELYAQHQARGSINTYPDVVYSSESYGADLAEDLSNLTYSGDVGHRMVDHGRAAVPISASKLRKNLAAGWDFLAPATKMFFTKRFVVCGAESSGTTTLTRNLAERFQTVWVPEYGRTFSEAVGLSHRWTSDDFTLIAEEHQRQIELMARRAGPALFCDTDAFATAMFHELYMRQEAPTGVWQVAGNHETDNEAYFITSAADVPFEDDGYRLFRSQRAWATEWFQEKLPYATLLSGPPSRRLEAAAEIVEDSLRWNFEPAGDE